MGFHHKIAAQTPALDALFDLEITALDRFLQKRALQKDIASPKRGQSSGKPFYLHYSGKDYHAYPTGSPIGWYLTNVNKVQATNGISVSEWLEKLAILTCPYRPSNPRQGPYSHPPPTCEFATAIALNCE